MRLIDADVVKQTVKDMIMPYEVRQEVLKAIDETPTVEPTDDDGSIAERWHE